jgi:hypothetical protein
MARSKDAWLREDAGDLKEAEVEVGLPGCETVLVRGLPAAYSNQASSEALELKTVGREQVATVNTARLEVLQFAHGVIDPKFTEQEAEKVAEKFGPTFKKVIAEIDNLSGLDKEAMEAAQATFPVGNAKAGGSHLGNGPPSGGTGPVVPARTGAPSREVD